MMPAKLLAAQRALAKVVARQVGEEVGLPADEILGRRRYRSLCAARHRVMVELWRRGMSTTEIGEVMDMDHTTIMHGLQRALGHDAYRAETLGRYSPARLPSYRGRFRVSA